MRSSKLFYGMLPVVMILAGVLLNSCKKPAEPVGPTTTRAALGTTVTIQILDPGYDEASTAEIVNEIFTIFRSWERRVLTPGPENQVSSLSTGAGEKSVTVDDDVFDMLMDALRMYDASGKTFDIRYGPVLDAWNVDGEPRVPAQAELDSLQSLVTNGGMFVAGKSILLAKEAMRFDARQIAVGYILDAAAAKLAGHGIRSAVIHTPYIWRFIGDPPNRKGFKAVLPHPTTLDSAWATVYCPTGGMAYLTAASHEFEVGGVKYNTLFDPRSGMPAASCIGAAVQAPDAAAAQALAYGLFVHADPEQFTGVGKESVTGTIVVRGQEKGLFVDKRGTLGEHFDLE